MVFPKWSCRRHVCCRMIWFSAIPNWIAVATLITACLGAGRGPLSASACYGNTNEWIRLECVEGEKINVTKIIHGAKLKSDNCPSPADISTYRRECCLRNATDCLVTVQDSASVECNGKVMCSVKSTWSMVSKECNQDNYLDHTNYMIMEYTCVGPPTSIPPVISSTQVKVTEHDLKNTTTFLIDDKVIETSLDNTTTPRPSTRTVDVTSVKTTTTSQPVSANVTATTLSSGTSTVSFVSNTQKHTATSTESKDELSDAMVGAIVGGSLGMLFTLMAFIFYWGRKRRLRIVGKSQPTVWDYLLSQTFTVRGTRGYDHFSSVRSSVMSDSEANSPTSRKTTWLPNIVHRDSIPRDDSISNYDNDADRQHSVEIHPHATPTPYAFLNLYVDPGNQTHHDA
ncbi:unnamed protein product [Lymnaea stagnalis]|uniref:Uncharacterized protein n=1 Tax=Lymnaea stagnalis TaxID=6523 RepID=A0AAV2I0T8_LYMST